ncbi:MAG: sialate O-acetylesterase [Planctomycetaceae bacterium]|nr:sialate O-acetylesterase [Planctomycetaceae bacterium]
MRICRRLLIAALMLMPAANIARADVRLPAIFGNNACLQQGIDLPVWGWADPGEEVTVKIGDSQKKATAGDNGRWMVKLPPVKEFGPVSLSITGKNAITLENVIVGDVWICSGQSNMEWSVAASGNPQEEIANAKHPKIRIFKVSRATALEPQENCTGQWVECSPETIADKSAVGYFFGRALHQGLEGRPIGLINTAWGGTVAEAWTSHEMLASKGDYGPILERTTAANADPKNANNPNRASVLYNGMIAPLVPYAIKGAIWYQGESNAGRAYQYRTLMPDMIGDWRNHWGQGPFPFFMVQLANFMKKDEQPTESAWAELREAQLMTAQSLPHTGMAVIIDIGEANDIHPKNKQDVGKRLALSALHVAYGRDLVWTGPTYQSLSRKDGKIVLQFHNVGGGLVVKGDKLTGFAICGEDRKWVWADAKVEGNTVVVSSPEVKAPFAVRYGWGNNPDCNLYNAEGLPASPFRTDTFDGVTINNK